MIRLTRLLSVCLFLMVAATASARFVEFQFELRSSAENPFARELSAEITLPGGQTRVHPAFYLGDGKFAVRVFPRESGTYGLGMISEGGRSVDVIIHGDRTRSAQAAVDRFIRIDPKDPLAFVREGRPYFPIGANLPWPVGTHEGFYTRHLALFGQQQLNWARIWMAHWAGLNLDWVLAHRGRAVPLGSLSLEVAARWDEIVEAAESNGVAFQWVFQHHGQYSETVNSNWDENPWNVRNGGFLEHANDFFTDSRARELTKRKYRYIVARWGYSPAVMAWELFNEVHFSQPFRDEPAREDIVAAWHAEMAAYIRSLDVERHLVTTSFESLDGKVYDEMDYKQPHLYAADMTVATLALPTKGEPQTKPVFFGEIGDDQLYPSPEDRASGESLLLPIWTSLFGDSRQMGQTWYVERLVDSGRLGELGAVASFAKLAGLAERPHLKPRLARVSSEATAPQQVNGSLWWMHYPNVEARVPFDGSVPLELAFVPKNILSVDHGKGYPDRASLRFDAPEATRVTVDIEKANRPGAKIELRLNGEKVAERAWSAEASTEELNRGAKIDLPIPAGEHRLELVNVGHDWVLLRSVTFARKAPVLNVVAKGDDSFVCALVWRRIPGAAVKGVVALPALPAGQWRSAWVDTRSGTASEKTVFHHAGGDLAVSTPAVDRMAALILEKLP